MFLVRKLMINTSKFWGILFQIIPFCCRVSNGTIKLLRSGKFSSQFRKAGISRQWSPKIILKSDILNSPACRGRLKHGENLSSSTCLAENIPYQLAKKWYQHSHVDQSMGGQTGDRSRKTPFLRKVIPHRTIDSTDFGQAPKMHQTPQGPKNN